MSWLIGIAQTDSEFFLAHAASFVFGILCGVLICIAINKCIELDENEQHQRKAGD